MKQLLLLILVILNACSAAPSALGTLEGHVTIGPLGPVLREGEPPPKPTPEVYASRQIVIFAADGRTEVTRAKIEADGSYRLALPAGTYVVDINHAGIDQGVGLPKKIEIRGQKATRLDVEIDTGIR